MAHIDIETEKADYRVIFGAHGTPTSARQLPDECTALHLGRRVSSVKSTGLEKQYEEIVEVGREKGIPIVLAEPACNMTRIDALMSNFDLAFKVFSLIGMPAGLYLAFSKREVKREDLAFRWGNRTTSFVLQRSFSANFVDWFRPLVISQRAETFADFQRENEINRPNIALVIGGAHTLIVRALEMPIDERIQEILRNPHLPEYFQLGQFHIGYFTRFSHKENTWVAGSFEDSRLDKL